MKPMRLLFLFSAVFMLALSSCKQKGCMDFDAHNYSEFAEKSDGLCTYRYFSKITVRANESESWDLISAPDMYLKYAKTSSDSWDYVSGVLDDSYVFIWTLDESILMTNESWDFEVWDEDLIGSDQLMITGSFNPLDDGALIYSNGNGSIEFEYTTR